MGKLFVMLFARHCATYQDQNRTRHPDSHSCMQYTTCTMTIFCLRDNPASYREYRDTAPVPFSSIIYREKDSAVYQTCTATAPERNKIRIWKAKSTPYLSCHRDNFPAKVPGPVAGWLRQVTQPPHIAGPLCVRYWATDNYKDMTNTLHITARTIISKHDQDSQHTSKSLAACHRDNLRPCQTHAFFQHLTYKFG